MKALFAAFFLAGALWAAQPSPEAESFYALGYVFMQSGDYQRALPYLLEAVKKNPEHARAWSELGLCRAGMGDWKESAAAYQRAAELNGTARLLAAMHSDDPGDWCRTAAVNAALLGIGDLIPPAATASSK